MTNLEQTLIPALEHVEEGLAVPAPILLVCFLRVDGHLCPDLKTKGCDLEIDMLPSFHFVQIQNLSSNLRRIVGKYLPKP